MSNNLFSIIIPTRQRHETLKYSIQSVLNQTYDEFELVVMDNCSSSETFEVVASFSDPRIKYYRSIERLSMSDNWELGLAYATGEYIFILGDDDGLMPDGLELCLKLLREYKVNIISWFRCQYWWSNATVPWHRGRLYLNLSQTADIWNSKEVLKQFYKHQAIFEHLPMLYNSFIHRDVISRIKSNLGEYFMSTSCPDIYSGIVNAYFSDTYLYSFRSLSIAGLSQHSTGTSTGYLSMGLQPIEDFMKDGRKDLTDLLNDNSNSLIPSLNQEICVAEVQIRTKQLFFSKNNEFELNIKNLLKLVAARINRDPDNYDSTLRDIEALADKYEINVSTLDIPKKFIGKPQPYQGPIVNPDGSINTIVINCEQAGVSNVAQAAALACAILPKIEAVRVNTKTQLLEQQASQSSTTENVEPIIPQILLDGFFFQLYQTGIARVWRSVLEEWAEDSLAKHLVVLDRAGTAPKIPGIRYRTIPLYDYDRTDADRIMLQQVCDEEGASLFTSTYYTTPLSTPFVFMAYDMIPEVMGWDLNHPMWREKHHAIQKASTYVAISENTARDIIKFFPHIYSEAVTVAPCGVKSSFTPASLEEINNFRTKYGVLKPYFILVGMGGYKNTKFFFQAFAQLHSRQDFEVVCTGSSGLSEVDFTNYTSGSVVHRLQLSDEEFKAAYSGAVALVYPSKYEGFGLPVLEAIACGCPVITCPNASIPEVAGEAALYVSDEDVDDLVNALCDVQKPEVRNSLIAAGLEQAKKFSWSKMAKTVSSALIEATLLPLKLRDTNLIIFPDWSQPEEPLCLDLQQVLEAIATHPDSSQITLLVDTSNISDEDATLILSSITMNLLLQKDLDVSEGPEISLIGQLGEIQWEALLRRIQARIILENENKQAIAQAGGQKITFCDLDGLSKLTAIST